MGSSARPGLPTRWSALAAAVRWGFCLAAVVVAGVVVGFAVGLVRPRRWPRPVAPG